MVIELLKVKGKKEYTLVGLGVNWLMLSLIFLNVKFAKPDARTIRFINIYLKYSYALGFELWTILCML